MVTRATLGFRCCVPARSRGRRACCQARAVPSHCLLATPPFFASAAGRCRLRQPVHTRSARPALNVVLARVLTPAPRSGDIVTHINGKPVTNHLEATTLIAKAETDVTLSLLRTEAVQKRSKSFKGARRVPMRRNA